jgi:Lrp/AsnC family transcriptional regulator for asnA, asnC and gidA
MTDKQKNIIAKIHTMFEISSYIDRYMSENKIDSIDIQILRLLQGDARKSFKEIATQCGVSTDTINNRFNAMEKKGIILGTTIVIDPKKLEKKYLVFIGIQVTHPYSDQVLNMVKRISGMCVVTRAIGRYDIEAIAVLDDIEKIGMTKSTIGDFQQVKNVEVDILVDKPLLCPKNFELD